MRFLTILLSTNMHRCLKRRQKVIHYLSLLIHKEGGVIHNSPDFINIVILAYSHSAVTELSRYERAYHYDYCFNN